MIVNAVGIGIFVSLLFTEITGFLAGGIISAGYLALFLDQPTRLAVTIMVSIITYAGILGLSQVTFIYGRRRFALSVLLGYLLGGLSQFLPFEMFASDQDLRVIGYIIPGLIANDMLKQGVLPTIICLFSVAFFVRLLLFLIVF